MRNCPLYSASVPFTPCPLYSAEDSRWYSRYNWYVRDAESGAIEYYAGGRDSLVSTDPAIKRVAHADTIAIFVMYVNKDWGSHPQRP